MINAVVFVMQHERSEAIEAYQDRLSVEQINEIYDAPDTAIIRLDFTKGGTQVMVIEEG